MKQRPDFKIICPNCDGLGIAIEAPESAPSSTIVKCRNCDYPGGTLGGSRSLATSDRNDLFEI